MRESAYQAALVKRIKTLLPGCFIQQNDPKRNQGMPDLLILFRDQWAMLEVKAHEGAPNRPNQPHWVDHFDDMSFAAFIYPENEEEVLDALQSAFGALR